MALRVSSSQQNRSPTPGLAKTLERAREKFANLLIDEVARSLGEPTLDEFELALIEMRLLGYHYCREVLR